MVYREKENLVQDKSFEFSLHIIDLFQQLQQEKEFVISKQLLKSGTSIGANIEEAIAAQSKKDFLSKMSIALKEARETRYWLKLLNKSDLTNLDVTEYFRKSVELINILSAIVKSTKERL